VKVFTSVIQTEEFFQQDKAIHDMKVCFTGEMPSKISFVSNKIPTSNRNEYQEYFVGVKAAGA
jgi:hypothetical protein